MRILILTVLLVWVCLIAWGTTSFPVSVKAAQYEKVHKITRCTHSRTPEYSGTYTTVDDCVKETRSE